MARFIATILSIPAIICDSIFGGYPAFLLWPANTFLYLHDNLTATLMVIIVILFAILTYIPKANVICTTTNIPTESGYIITQECTNH
jgi:hypothetical protein